MLPGARLSKAASLVLLTALLSAAQLVPVDEKGYAQMIASHHGRIVLVDFWATWCGPCREELPKLVTLSKKLDAKKFRLVTVSADEAESSAAVMSFLDKQGVGSPRYIKHADDDQVFIDSIDRQWSGALPALFLYDRSGARIQSFIGESDLRAVEAAIRKALQ